MMKRMPRVAVSPMNAVAGVSFAVLCGALGWTALNREPETAPIFARALQEGEYTGAPAESQIRDMLADGTSTTPVGDAVIGQFAARYGTLSQSGISEAQLAETAADITPSITVRTYAAPDVLTRPETTLEAVLEYREQMRDALVPLLNNTTPELEIYARWIDTRDTQYLDTIAAIAQDYDLALSKAALVRAPADAVHYHAGVLTAMARFSAALKALAHNAEDPIASLTLLRTYNAAEQEMLTAFNALGLYAAQKTQP